MHSAGRGPANAARDGASIIEARPPRAYREPMGNPKGDDGSGLMTYTRSELLAARDADATERRNGNTPAAHNGTTARQHVPNTHPCPYCGGPAASTRKTCGAPACAQAGMRAGQAASIAARRAKRERSATTPPAAARGRGITPTPAVGTSSAAPSQLRGIAEHNNFQVPDLPANPTRENLAAPMTDPLMASLLTGATVERVDVRLADGGQWTITRANGGNNQ
jgi:hypothetical protein